MKIDDFLKEEMNWTDRYLEYRPVIGYWKVAELLQKWGEKQLMLGGVVFNEASIPDKETELLQPEPLWKEYDTDKENSVVELCGWLHSTDWYGKCFKCGKQLFIREPK